MALTYAAVLVWAGGLTATDAATAIEPASAQAGQAVAGTLVAATAEMEEELAVMSEIPTPAEAPLVTLALAAGLVVLALGWYAVHTYRQRHPRVRSARLIVRHITTLM